ncbi:unnamed protein product [Prorocentrum cordatum]|uniref:Tyr recombinase domain-containing protein n=1 Tax=Prorocentrum cordatum TaxID=2364126 RepID=A0ABN9PWH1_9DINO|nr:unnamed protein product [Polarella glacialis]
MFPEIHGSGDPLGHPLGSHALVVPRCELCWTLGRALQSAPRALHARGAPRCSVALPLAEHVEAIVAARWRAWRTCPPLRRPRREGCRPRGERGRPLGGGHAGAGAGAAALGVGLRLVLVLVGEVLPLPPPRRSGPRACARPPLLLGEPPSSQPGGLARSLPAAAAGAGAAAAAGGLPCGGGAAPPAAPAAAARRRAGGAGFNPAVVAAAQAGGGNPQELAAGLAQMARGQGVGLNQQRIAAALQAMQARAVPAAGAPAQLGLGAQLAGALAAPGAGGMPGPAGLGVPVLPQGLAGAAAAQSAVPGLQAAGGAAAGVVAAAWLQPHVLAQAALTTGSIIEVPTHDDALAVTGTALLKLGTIWAADALGTFATAVFGEASTPVSTLQFEQAWSADGGAPLVHLCSCPRERCQAVAGAHSVYHVDVLRVRGPLQLSEAWARPAALLLAAPAGDAGAGPLGEARSKAVLEAKVAQLKQALKRRREGRADLFSAAAKRARGAAEPSITGDGRDAESLFHDAPSGSATNRIQRAARHRPGALLESGLSEMARFLGERAGAMAAYLNGIFFGQHPQSGMSQHSVREMRTIAHAIDGLLEGKLPEVGDLLIQRLKALELSVRDKGWAVASQLELMDDQPGIASLSERQAAAQHAPMQARLAEARAPRSRSRRGRSQLRSAADGERPGRKVAAKEIEEATPHDAPQVLLRPARSLPTRLGEVKAAKQWTHVLIIGLNHLHANCSADPERCVQRGPPSPAQLRSLRMVGTAETLTVEQVLPALPPVGIAASVEAAPLCDPVVRRALLDADSMAIPEGARPAAPPHAKIWASDEAWEELVEVLWARGLVEPIDLKDVLHVGGKLALCGAFGARQGTERTVKLRDGPYGHVLRFIMNLAPSNVMQRVVGGDVVQLPLSSQWSTIALLSREIMPRQCFFYAFRPPPCWRKLMAFRAPVPGRLVGKPDKARVHVASAAVAMGWISATGVSQHIHRNVLKVGRPRAAGLEPEAEWRRDRGSPLTPRSSDTTAWEVCVDNLEIQELIDRVDAEEPPNGYASQLISLTLWVLAQRGTCGRHWQIALGRWVRVFARRRGGVAAFEHAWRWISGSSRGWVLPLPMVEELVLAMSFAPLHFTDFRLSISPEVTCSDASPFGGGVVVSRGLTPAVEAALARSGRLPWQRSEDELVIISLLDGIAGGRCAWAALGLDCCWHISSEIDQVATRVARNAFPDLKELGGVRLVTREVEFLFENVDSADRADIGAAAKLLGRKPYRVCASQVCHMRRPRLYWCSFCLVGDAEHSIEERDLWRQVKLDADPGHGSRWLRRGASWPAGDDPAARLPTAARRERRSPPRPRPAGFAQCDPAALQRRADDGLALPPYQYIEKHCVHERGEWRPPCAEEREVLMGFPRGHTQVAVPSGVLKDDLQHAESFRCSLLGNAFHVEVVAWLLGHLAVKWQFLASVPSVDLLRESARPVAASAFCSSRGFAPEHALVLDVMRSTSTKGSDVSWQQAAHINELGMRAYLSALRWRLRAEKNLQTKFLHLLDSQVSIAVLTKHRSGSRQLNRIARKVSALELASGVMAILGFCRSGVNPALDQGWPQAVDAADMDQQICTFIENLWIDGEGRNLAGDRDAAKSTAHMSVTTLCGIFHVLWQLGRQDAAVLILVAFHCLLRTGELVSIRAEHVLTNASRTGLVALPWTKSGARRGAQELVTVDDPVVGRALAWLRQRQGAGPLLLGAGAQFRLLFERACVQAGLEEVGIEPRSPRRGGATHDACTRGDLGRAVHRGRWSDLRTAQIYINDGLAAVAQQRVPDAAARDLAARAAALARLLASL